MEKNFSYALKAMKEGKPVRRSNWATETTIRIIKGNSNKTPETLNDKEVIDNMDVSLFEVDSTKPNFTPTIAVFLKEQRVKEYFLTMSDLLAENWIIIEAEVEQPQN